MPEPLRVESLEDLDALVAQKVMGWTLTKERNWYGLRMGAPAANKHGTLAGIALNTVPRYSKLIAAAWEVVERMAEGGWRWTADDRPDAGEPFRFAWRFHRGTAIHRADSPTVPLAICLAALAAKGVEVELSLPEAEERR